MDTISLRQVGWRTLWVCLALALPNCGGGSDSNGAPDAAAIAAAPQATKDICERVCSAADMIRTSACGSVEFSSHAECYRQCVSRYLTYPSCKEDFDDSNNCAIDEGCNYQTSCRSLIIFAAVCLQGG
jgi:hypothetical protein